MIQQNDLYLAKQEVQKLLFYAHLEELKIFYTRY